MVKVWIPRSTLHFFDETDRENPPVIYDTKKRGRGLSVLVEATFDLLTWLESDQKYRSECYSQYSDAIKRIEWALEYGDAPMSKKKTPTKTKRCNKPHRLKRKGVEVTNYTNWSSVDIAKMVQGAIEESEYRPRKSSHLRVDVDYHMGNIGVSGLAYLNNDWIKIMLPRVVVTIPFKIITVTDRDSNHTIRRETSIAADCARVIEHEIRHCMGEDHHQMPEMINDATQPIPWAVGMVLRWEVSTDGERKIAAKRRVK